MAQTPPQVIQLPRHMPTRTIEAAVMLAVAVEHEFAMRWPARLHREIQPGNRQVLLGQNSCFTPAKLQVRPQGGSLFDIGTAYSTIEVAWCVSWPRIDCEGHRHGGMSRAETIRSLATRIHNILCREI